jgi:hypothetical protein
MIDSLSCFFHNKYNFKSNLNLVKINLLYNRMKNIFDFLFRQILSFFFYISKLDNDTNTEENTECTDEMVSLLFD